MAHRRGLPKPSASKRTIKRYDDRKVGVVKKVIDETRDEFQSMKEVSL